MNIWFRYFLGALAGVLLGIFLPLAGGDTAALLQDVTLIVVYVGRVLLFPLVFFAMIIAVDELHSDGLALGVAVRFVFWTALSTAFAVVLGVISILVLAPQRIPPMVQEGQAAAAPSVLAALQNGISPNMFQMFVIHPNALAGILLVGLLVGLNLRFDRGVTSPVSLVADSANRIFYRLNSILIEGMGVLLIVPAAALLVLIREVPDLQLFGQFLLVTTVVALVIGVVIYPLVLFFLFRAQARPLRWLAAMGAPAIAAITTADAFFSLGTMVRMVKEPLGIHRRYGGSVVPVAALYGRSGTAMLSVAGFLLVIRSYTALEIGMGDMVQLTVAAVLYSFLLTRVPAGGVALLLSYLATRYGRGMEESYLILLPVIPVMERIGAFLDTMTVGFITQVISSRPVKMRSKR